MVRRWENQRNVRKHDSSVSQQLTNRKVYESGVSISDDAIPRRSSVARTGVDEKIDQRIRDKGRTSTDETI